MALENEAFIIFIENLIIGTVGTDYFNLRSRWQYHDNCCQIILFTKKPACRFKSSSNSDILVYNWIYNLILLQVLEYVSPVYLRAYGACCNQKQEGNYKLVHNDYFS